MPFGSIPDTRTRPSRIAGAIETIGHQPHGVLPGTGRTGRQACGRP